MKKYDIIENICTAILFLCGLFGVVLASVGTIIGVAQLLQ